MKNLLFSVAMAFCSFAAAAEVVTYPAPDQLKYNKDFSVRVRAEGCDTWIPVDIYSVKVDQVKDARHNVRIASMAYFDMDTCNVTVEVTRHGDAIDTARVRPLSYSIPCEITNDSVMTFTIDRPCNLSIEVNGDIFHNLHLFANPTVDPALRRMVEKRRRKSPCIYFAPGIHRLEGDTLRIPSNTTVFIDGGARIYGVLMADSVHDVRIAGRGIVHPEGRGAGIEIRNSKNVTVDGVITTQCPVGGSDSVRINNVKVISSYGWGDGLNVFASSNVHYDHCFARNSDDCTTVYATRKGFTGSARNITMERSTLWADVAHPIMIGLHGNVERPDTIENLIYRDIDILDHSEMQLDYQGCMAISCGDDNLVRNVLFEDIRVEDFRQGQLVNLRIFFNKKYCLAPGRGIHDITFRDITYDGHNAEISIIAGYDDTRKVTDITFDNLIINGIHIHDDMPGKPKWYKTGDMGRIFIGEHVDNLTFK